MVDDLTTAPEPTPEGGPTPKKGLAGLLATTTGKIVAAVVALVVLGGVVAVVFFLLVPVLLPGLFGGGAQSNLVPATTPGASKPATGTAAEETAAPVVPAKVSNTEVFTFRDIFKPLIGPEPSATESGTGEAGEADTLYLQDVVTEDGERKAVLLWNGKTYTLAEGEAIPDTPWEVVSIATSSVTMLYGDSSVTLGVGQGFAGK